MEYKLTFREYNKSLKTDKLLGLKCNNCHTITCPPKMTCQECASTDLEVTELSGEGKIVTYTVIYVAPEGRENETPYAVVLVELKEGPWIMGNLIDIDPARVGMELIGRQVKLGHKVFPGDKYSDGDAARPLFSFAD
ncbi:MAG: Zn-ribbon domain-containing OB-fold protein [Syntrophobacterales bacterium]|nr:Zn-ribbon domain-containing OB-fold protein [Syntrophobacterales bacterium]